MIHHIENNQINQEVLNTDKLVIIDFFATWCMPCQMLTPILSEVDKENQNVEIFKVNVDENRELAKEFRVMSIPTVIFFKDGEEVDRMVGASPKNAYLERLEKLK